MLAASGRSPSERPALRRPRSLPEWAGLAGVGGWILAAGWDGVLATTRWRPACVVRSRLGVPCPFCGGTTAALHLVEGRWTDAVGANPLAVVLLAGSVVGLVLFALRTAGWCRGPTPWSIAAQRRAALVLAAGLVASWCYQVDRLGHGEPATRAAGTHGDTISECVAPDDAPGPSPAGAGSRASGSKVAWAGPLPCDDARRAHPARS